MFLANISIAGIVPATLPIIAVFSVFIGPDKNENCLPSEFADFLMSSICFTVDLVAFTNDGSNLPFSSHDIAICVDLAIISILQFIYSICDIDPFN